MITDDICPEDYRYWRLTLDPPVATLTCADAGTSSDALLRADIELSDALQRLRFEHPDVSVVVVTGADGFSTGLPDIPPGAPAPVVANVRALRDEVDRAIDDAAADSGQHWIAALDGPARGRGYELAVAAHEIVLVDDGDSAVALGAAGSSGEIAPESLARLVHKRGVRPDVVDVLCCSAEGVGGQRAADLGLVDLVVPQRCFAETVAERARAAAGNAAGGPAAEAVEFAPLRREEFEGGFAYPNVCVEIDDGAGEAVVTIAGPPNHECFAPDPGPKRLRARWWPLATCRELDDALLLLRTRTPEVATVVMRSAGDPLAVASADVALTSGYEHDWFVREVALFWKRVLQRLDRASQSVITLVEPGSCFVGTLLEVALASDRIYMVEGPAGGDPDAPRAEIYLTGMNFGPLPQGNGHTRLEARFIGRDEHLAGLGKRVGDPIPAAEAAGLGLVTEAVGAAAWEATTRRAIAERAGLPLATRTALAALRQSGTSR